MKGQRGNILTRLHTIMACSIPKECCTTIVEVIHYQVKAMKMYTKINSMLSIAFSHSFHNLHMYELQNLGIINPLAVKSSGNECTHHAWHKV